MHDTYSQCPKCGHVPLAPLPSDTPCPSCGIYPFKWGKTLPRAMNSSGVEGSGNGFQFSSLLNPLDEIGATAFTGRCLVLLIVSIWSLYLIGCDYRTGEIFGSFMHNILLPIHEAGHVLCIPFGEFVTIVGGSLFQLALPLGIGIAFVVINRDNFGAGVAMWWTSVSLLDLSPYVYDALHPQLIMLGGHTGEDGPHDWIYLLNTFDQIPNAQSWGGVIHGAGALLVMVSLGWLAAILWQQKSKLIVE